MSISGILRDALPSFTMARFSSHNALGQCCQAFSIAMLCLKSVEQRPQIAYVRVQRDCPVEPAACLVDLNIINERRPVESLSMVMPDGSSRSASKFAASPWHGRKFRSRLDASGQHAM